MERRGTRTIGERLEGAKWDEMEPRGNRSNGGGLGRNKEGLDGMERSHLSQTKRNHLPTATPSRPSPSCPVPLHPVPSLSILSRPVPLHPVQSLSLPSRPFHQVPFRSSFKSSSVRSGSSQFHLVPLRFIWSSPVHPCAHPFHLVPIRSFKSLRFFWSLSVQSGSSTLRQVPLRSIWSSSL